MYNRLKHLLSPLFISCLFLLLLNDFYLKPIFHNIITGKLSDFCGLFIFPIFWSVFFPRHKSRVFIFSGILFIFWKSQYADGFIELVNNVFNIQRTVDPTDLMALPVLLVGWFYIKDGPYITNHNTILARLSGPVIGAVTIFSLCATSQQRAVQSFDQPQYVLLKSAITPDSNSYEELRLYKKDSLLVVKVNYLFITEPVKGDDYNKNRSLKELDKDVLARIADSASLIPPGKITALTINTVQGKDSLRFNGGRLDGRFTRTKNNKLIIEGFYKMGIEDSIWTFRDASSNKAVIKKFVNGERTNLKQFEDGKLVFSTSINTRADTIRNTYIEIGMLILGMLGIILLLRRNYRITFPEQLELKLAWKWMVCLISPILVCLAHAAIRILLGDFNQDFFERLATIIFIFIITWPLMFIIVFKIKLRKEIDMLLYCLLLGFACSIWTTISLLIALIISLFKISRKLRMKRLF